MGTKQFPGKFDCYANAFNHEPMFVLLARDDKAANLVRKWASDYQIEKERLNKGSRMTVEQYAKFVEAMDCADAMEAWRNDYHNQNAVKRQKTDRNALMKKDE